MEVINLCPYKHCEILFILASYIVLAKYYLKNKQPNFLLLPVLDIIITFSFIHPSMNHYLGTLAVMSSSVEDPGIRVVLR